MVETVNQTTLRDLEQRIMLLSQQEKLWLLEHLAQTLRQDYAPPAETFAASLKQMAADPEIQREIRAIQGEFAVAEADGLESL
jgi:hypothetical protein